MESENAMQKTSMNNIIFNIFQSKYLRTFVVYIHILVPVTFKCCKRFGAKFYPTNDPVTSFITA